MFKLTDPTDLEKAGRSLGSFFTKRAEELEKSHTFHKSMATHHEGAAAASHAAAATHQAAHDGLDNSHELKAAHGALAGHHTALAGHHSAMAKAHSDHAASFKTMADTEKALAADWGGVAAKAAAAGAGAPAAGSGAPLEPGSGIAAMVTETTAALTKRALESLDSDPMVQDKIREMVLKGVATALGDKIIPDNVHGVIPGFPGITAVPRTGQRPIPAAEKHNVPLEFASLVKVSDDEDE